MSEWIGAVSGRVADFTIGTAIVVVHVMLANRRGRGGRGDRGEESRKSNFLLPMNRN
ncbi:MAG TPA: hypothetical protein VM261_21095 [Kofleriaceae bacterium]|nr:hypothetical protein [Kofleriaceae bacterium]